MSVCTEAMTMNQPSLPHDVKMKLDEHTGELEKKFGDGIYRKSVCRAEWLPGYYIKYGANRVSNAQKLKKAIKDNNLHLMAVPEKYAYGNLTIAQEIPGEKDGIVRGLMSLEQAEQLFLLVKNGPYYDPSHLNHIISPDGKVYIIDTDDRAVPNDSVDDQLVEKAHWFVYGNLHHTEKGRYTPVPHYCNDPVANLEESLNIKRCLLANNPNTDKIVNFLCTKIKEHEESRKMQIGTGLALANEYLSSQSYITRFINQWRKLLHLKPSSQIDRDSDFQNNKTAQLGVAIALAAMNNEFQQALRTDVSMGNILSKVKNIDYKPSLQSDKPSAGVNLHVSKETMNAFFDQYLEKYKKDIQNNEKSKSNQSSTLPFIQKYSYPMMLSSIVGVGMYGWWRYKASR